MGYHSSGCVDVVFYSADLSGALRKINDRGIAIYDLHTLDSYSAQFAVSKTDIPWLRSFFEKRGESFQIKEDPKRRLSGIALLQHPILMILICLLIVLTYWLPSRVLFIYTEGNQRVGDQMIIEQAEQAGLRFMTSRRDIRNDHIKNEVLENIPELQWVGINTYGCVAVITVRERSEVTTQEEAYPISNMVARCDGVIRDIVVEQGSAQCHVGQAVKRGQILISGYTDCGLHLKGTNAKGEVYGDTIREISVCFPQNFEVRTEMKAVEKKYSLILGKKRINLSKGSGISGTTCAKIYEEKYIALPGGFVLPIKLVVETIWDYQTETQIFKTAPYQLSEFAQGYLMSRFQPGKIYSSDFAFADNEKYCVLSEKFYCYEMIGITHIEERVPEYE